MKISYEGELQQIAFNYLHLVGDHVKISKQKNIFAKGYTPNWSE